MSVHVVAGLSAAQAFDVSRAVREPLAVEWVESDGRVSLTLTFVPDLTAEEATLLADLAASYRQHGVELTLDEYRTLKPRMAEIRTFRTRTTAEWSAMTAAQRDNALVQWCQDLTDVLRALLRD